MAPTLNNLRQFTSIVVNLFILPFLGFCLALSAALGGGLTDGVVPFTLDSGVSSAGFMLAVPGRGPVPVPGREAAAEEDMSTISCFESALKKQKPHNQEYSSSA